MMKPHKSVLNTLTKYQIKKTNLTFDKSQIFCQNQNLNNSLDAKSQNIDHVHFRKIV